MRCVFCHLFIGSHESAKFVVHGFSCCAKHIDEAKDAGTREGGLADYTRAMYAGGGPAYDY